MRAVDAISQLITANVSWSGGLAEIVSFDASTQSAEIRPLLTVDGEPAPNVLDCPVMLMAGGDWSVNVELSQGDFVAVLYTSQPVALWAQGDESTSELEHASVTNAIVLPCVTRQASANTTGVAAGITCKNKAGTVQLKMSDAGIELKGQVEMTQTADVGGNMRVGTAVPIAAFTVNTHTHNVTAVGSPTGPPIPGT